MRFPKWPRWVWRCYAATFAAVTTFVVCSLLPMWPVIYHGKACSVGEIHSLWGMLARIELEPRTDGSWVWYGWKMGAVRTAVSVHIAAIVGAVLAGVRWRKGTPTPAAICSARTTPPTG